MELSWGVEHLSATLNVKTNQMTDDQIKGVGVLLAIIVGHALMYGEIIKWVFQIGK